MIQNFEILGTTLSFVDKTTGEKIADIKDVTNVKIDEEYEKVSFGIELPDGSKYSGIGDIKREDLEKIIR